MGIFYGIHRVYVPRNNVNSVLDGRAPFSLKNSFPPLSISGPFAVFQLLYRENFQGRPLTAVTSRALSSEKESYTARQAKTGRPVSPHVTIYDFPAAALTSIANRVTGIALVAGKRGPRILLGKWLVLLVIVCPVVDYYGGP